MTSGIYTIHIHYAAIHIHACCHSHTQHAHTQHSHISPHTSDRKEGPSRHSSGPCSCVFKRLAFFLFQCISFLGCPCCARKYIFQVMQDRPIHPGWCVLYCSLYSSVYTEYMCLLYCTVYMSVTNPLANPHIHTHTHAPSYTLTHPLSHKPSHPLTSPHPLSHPLTHPLTPPHTSTTLPSPSMQCVPLHQTSAPLA